MIIRPTGSATEVGNRDSDLRIRRQSREGRTERSRRCRSRRWRSPCAISEETSRDQPSAVLKATTRIGFLCLSPQRPSGSRPCQSGADLRRPGGLRALPCSPAGGIAPRWPCRTYRRRYVMPTELRSPRLAVLIDADNASAKIVDGLFEEIARERNFKRLHPPGKHADRSTV